jgi:hypothetical protein
MYKRTLNFAATFVNTYMTFVVHTFSVNICLSEIQPRALLRHSNNIAESHTKIYTGTEQTQNYAQVTRDASRFALLAIMIWMIKSSRMRRARHMACMWERSNAYGEHLEDITRI